MICVSTIRRNCGNILLLCGSLFLCAWKLSNPSWTFSYSMDNFKVATEYTNKAFNLSIKHREIQKVVLATYFRGGSTFLGEMINNNPDAFYMFEPLILPYNKWRNELKANGSGSSMFFYLNGTEFPLPEAALEDMSSIVVDILNCDFEKIDPRVLGHTFQTHWRKSRSLLPYQTCYTRAKRKYRRTKRAVKECLPVLKTSCTTSRIRCVKVIRMAGIIAERILLKDPAVKVVHYTRDVRGMLVSRAKFQGFRSLFRPSDLSEIAQHACDRIRHDIKTYAKLKQNHSILSMKYEDLAFEPADTMTSLYRFIRSDVPPEVIAWINDNTQAINSNGALGTRRNSTAVPERWRKVLSHQAINIINKQCKDVQEKLKYPS